MIIPKKLKKGDEVRVIAPSRSLSIISDPVIDVARHKLQSLGLKVSFSENAYLKDDFLSSSIEARIADLHNSFLDPEVKCVLTAIGGFNSNQLLNYIDYKLIKKHPKILCGYSDITALQNAILKKTNLVTYSGPHFSTFGMEIGIEYTIEFFKKCFFSDSSYEITPSKKWSDDLWYLDQKNRVFKDNCGPVIINPGKAEGIIIGGNLCTFNLLQGTNYFPSFRESLLFIEDDDQAGSFSDVEFDRGLQAVLHQTSFSNVKGVVFGRFQSNSCIDTDKLKKILSSKKELSHIPILANFDFGHTNPLTTFPIGGRALLDLSATKPHLIIKKH